jgi:hypothetical protein
MDSSFFVKHIIDSVTDIGNKVIHDETNSTHNEIEFLFEVSKLLDIYNKIKKEEDTVIINYSNDDPCNIFNYDDDYIRDIDTFGLDTIDTFGLDTLDIDETSFGNNKLFEKKEMVIINDYDKNIERLMKCTIPFKNDKITVVP